jgi:DNA (cytosine-5)-methyltransferase 3A
MKIRVLSLFDGISVGMLALKRAGFDVEKYYASEIKTKAMKCSFNNWGDAIEQIGDVRKVDGKKYDVDIIIGGSPYQNFSRARTSHCNVIDGLAGEQSSLFFEYLRILKENNPKYFFLENVWMPIDDQKIINRLLGVEPIRANSSLVSYQQRDRLYWTNIPGIELPKDRHINFQDYKDTDEEYCDKFIVNRTPSRERMWGDGNGECPNVTNREKINCITLKQDRWKNSGLIAYKDFCRYLTTRELEIGQTLPVGYTKGLSKNEAEDVIGDAWTADMIAHFFGYLKRDMEKKQEEMK